MGPGKSGHAPISLSEWKEAVGREKKAATPLPIRMSHSPKIRSSINRSNKINCNKSSKDKRSCKSSNNNSKYRSSSNNKNSSKINNNSSSSSASYQISNRFNKSSINRSCRNNKSSSSTCRWKKSCCSWTCMEVEEMSSSLKRVKEEISGLDEVGRRGSRTKPRPNLPQFRQQERKFQY